MTAWLDARGPAALCYHDVVPEDTPDWSGFPGAAAASYKLTREAFAGHLAALSELGEDGVTLTFDDGGRSAFEVISDMLLERRLRGSFFITSGRIGTAGFLSREQVRGLRRAGHAVGTHSVTHPLLFGSLVYPRMLSEWRESKLALEDVLGEEVSDGSVPGGLYSGGAGRAAAEAGLRLLFTSEPTVRPAEVAGCRVRGRFAVRTRTTPEALLDLAAGRGFARWRYAMLWHAKIVARKLGGTPLLRAREWVFRRRSRKGA